MNTKESPVVFEDFINDHITQTVNGLKTALPHIPAGKKRQVLESFASFQDKLGQKDDLEYLRSLRKVESQNAGISADRISQPSYKPSGPFQFYLDLARQPIGTRKTFHTLLATAVREMAQDIPPSEDQAISDNKVTLTLVND